MGSSRATGCYLRTREFKVAHISAGQARTLRTGIAPCWGIRLNPFIARFDWFNISGKPCSGFFFIFKASVFKAMTGWPVRCLYFLVLNAAVQSVTSLEEELSDSIFGKLPFNVLFHTDPHQCLFLTYSSRRVATHFLCKVVALPTFNCCHNVNVLTTIFAFTHILHFSTVYDLCM